MPEWSEVKIMSEYFNEIVEGKTFVNVRKSSKDFFYSNYILKLGDKLFMFM